MHSACQQIWKTQQYWKRSVFISIPKKGNAKECSKYHKISLISHTSKVMLKVLEDIDLPLSSLICAFASLNNSHISASYSEVNIFWNSLAFSMIQRMLAIWSLVPLPFLNPAWTSESSWFMYCWSLAWRILSITLLACEMRWFQLCSSLSILWHSLSLGLEWELTFSSPVANAELSRLVGILSAALSQHHLLGFEIAQLEFHHLH